MRGLTYRHDGDGCSADGGQPDRIGNLVSGCPHRAERVGEGGTKVGVAIQGLAVTPYAECDAGRHASVSVLAFIMWHKSTCTVRVLSLYTCRTNLSTGYLYSTRTIVAAAGVHDSGRRRTTHIVSPFRQILRLK
jgi:hypothetical protein